jgi:hypothetical protein
MALPKDTQIVRIPIQPWANNMLRDGLRPVEDKDYNAGYKDAAGTLVVPYIYSGAEEFHDGLGVVYKNNKLGAFDTSGKVAIPIIYDRLSAFSHGISQAAINDKFGIVNKKGAVMVPFIYEEMYLDRLIECAAPNSLTMDSLVKVSKIVTEDDGWEVEKTGYINLRGAVVVPLEYDDLGKFSEGLAWFVKSEKVGFLDTTGRVRIEAEYDEAKDFHEGLAAVMKDGYWGFIDTNGRVVIDFKYDALPRDEHFLEAGFKDGVAIVAKGRFTPAEPKWGYIDKTGKELTEFMYYTAHPVSEGKMAVQTFEDDILAGVLDKTGKTIIPFNYGYTGSFSQGRARIVTQTITKESRQNAIGYVDPAGKIVIPMKYTDSGDFNGSTTVPEYARVSTSFISETGQMYNPRYYTIDRDGKVVKPYGFESISNFMEGVAMAYDATGMNVVGYIIDKSWKAPGPIEGSQDVAFPRERMKLFIDGSPVELDAYRVADESYCRLGDLAKTLGGTAARFDIERDEAEGPYDLKTGSRYAPRNEKPAPAGSAAPAFPSASKIRIDGLHQESILLLTIAGEDYAPLNGLMAALGVKVGREGDDRTARMDTAEAAERRSIFRIVPRVNDILAIGISGSSKENGAKAVTWDNDLSVKVQEFELVPAGDKFCIVSVYSGKALTAENRKGAPVTFQTNRQSAGQLFSIEEGQQGYVSIRTTFGYYLGVSGGNRRRGATIITWNKTGNSSQQFKLVRAD